ncbi:DsrE family protein [Sphingomonas sp. CGMCC 1.13654]|uniref:DsrE family protein n=2 Tax=Sphingomonas chungangi TaxID=2683589 RepID=A0A838L8K6_9SPHN|nr:DsrE family protein [Sphingomonas chungangi]MBA2935082.1 DsrE family protein [Sphingomonas chungangi]MVW54198.1 peroxiredoxin [Sphingomonas chungangi]
MRGLTVIVTRPGSLRAGLELAAANAALGGRARLFAQGEAVAALALPMRAPHDPDHAAAGLPALAALFEEAQALGVEAIVCQSGLALMGVTADMLDARISFGGPVSVMQTLGEDRLATL